MKPYLICTEPQTVREFDISRIIWDLWELPGVKNWLETSKSRRQLLKRMEVAMRFYRDTLWWAMSLAYEPNQTLQGLNREVFDIEEFCWEGICPTAEAERHILENAATIGHSYREEQDITPEHLRQLLMANWTMNAPVSPFNRCLLSEHMLGGHGHEIRYGS